jgi:hypothetical protein
MLYSPSWLFVHCMSIQTVCGSVCTDVISVTIGDRPSLQAQSLTDSLPSGWKIQTFLLLPPIVSPSLFFPSTDIHFTDLLFFQRILRLLLKRESS